MNEVNLTGIQNAIAKYSSQNDKSVLRKDAQNFLDEIKERSKGTERTEESIQLEKEETKKGTIIDTYA